MALVFRTAAGEQPAAGNENRPLTEWSRDAGLPLNMRCGGKGSCRGCIVYLEEGRFLLEGAPVTAARGRKIEARACQCYPAGPNGKVFVPGTSIIETSAKIEDDFILPSFQPAAWCRALAVEIEPATLHNPTSDADRLREAVHTKLNDKDISLPVSLLRRLPATLGERGGPAFVVLNMMNGRWIVSDVLPAEEKPRLLGVAVDIGTTTVAVALVDLETNVVLRKASRYNAQISRADDVGSRIGYCDNEERLEEMQQLIVQQTINPLIDELCRVERTRPNLVYRIAVSGNTVMSHLFLGISPEGMGRVPFHPVETVFDDLSPRLAGLSANERGVLQIIPSVAGYIGGDITSDLYMSGLPREGETTLMADIGTNGEIVLCHEGKLIACATAAGPAFEGHGIKHGCRAATGAIEGIGIEDEMQIKADVIGNASAVGICGTGIIDFMAEGLRAGLINRMGRFNLDLIPSLDVSQTPGHEGVRVHACVIVSAENSATGHSLLVTEADIAQILKAKAAIFAGMKTLLDEQGIIFAQIDRFVLAGGFGRHLKIHNAITIGLLPELPLDRFDVIGNGSLAGACLALIDANAPAAYRHLAGEPRVVELNLCENFESNFIDALAMPNLEDELFPRTVSGLGG